MATSEEQAGTEVEQKAKDEEPEASTLSETKPESTSVDEPSTEKPSVSPPEVKTEEVENAEKEPSSTEKKEKFSDLRVKTPESKEIVFFEEKEEPKPEATEVDETPPQKQPKV